MLPVSHVMTPDVITVSPELGLRDAMELFSAHHISGAPVVAARQVLGVVTLSDLVGLAATAPGALRLRESSGGAAVEDEPEPLREGEEPPATFFTELWEDPGADVVAEAGTTDARDWSGLDSYTVRDAMTEGVLHLPPDADVRRAAEFMQKHAIHRVLVMADDELLGILTTTDIARAVSEHRLSERRFVFGRPQYREDGSWW